MSSSVQRAVWAVLVFGCLPIWVRARRLPRMVIPEHYQVRFAPDFETNKFVGEESIQVRVLEPTSSITLNAVEIEFEEVTISSEKMSQAARVTADPKQETALLAVPVPIAAGPAEIHMRFTGVLNDKLRGFYRAPAQGRKYAVTQFEPTDARRAFPCFDEPDLKATFALSVVADRADTAISNGKIVRDTPGPGSDKHTLEFSTTAKMSTYLVALAVGDFQCLEGDVRGVPVRVCSTPDKKELGRFALEATRNFLSFYNRYFGVPYPFGKLDIVAVPNFEAGAMENAAAIFSRDEILLDERKTPVSTLKWWANALAHEIAHQWFGDLVTMEWWDDVWLSEGFATWLAPKAVQAWKPEWNPMIDEVRSTGRALDTDSLKSSRPIRARAESPAEINQLFDSIAYEKTAAVLRMLEAFLGEEVFRGGIGSYLNEHAYGNATAEDLWDLLSRVSRQPVNQIMPTFVDQPGVPLVRVETECEGETLRAKLIQERYFYDPNLFNEGSNQIWQLPVCMKWPGGPDGSSTTQCVLLTHKEQTFELPRCAPWVFLNANARGYYRSSYIPKQLERIAAVAEEHLTPEEHIVLLRDGWAMLQVGRDSISNLLTLVEDLKNDRAPEVLQVVAGYLRTVGDDLVNDGDREQYRAWVRDQFRPMAEELGWQPTPNESDERRALRATVIDALGYIGRDPEVLARASAMAERVIEDPSSVEATLARTVINLAALNGDQKLYERFLSRIQAVKSPPDYSLYLDGLTSFTRPELLQRTLEYALSPDVRSQDTPTVFRRVMQNPAGRELAWNFTKSHWPELEKKLSIWGRVYVISSTSSFCDSKSRDDVKQFFTQNRLEAGASALQRSLERIGYCIDLKARQEASLASRFERRPRAGQ